MKGFVTSLTVLGLLFFSLFASASITPYTDRTNFETDTGATVRGLPSANGVSSVTTNDGTITVSAGGKAIFVNQTGTYGDALPGSDEYVISGDESHQMVINLVGQPAYSFGFSMFEPTNTGVVVGCNATCVDSTFRIEFFLGASSLGFFDINAPNDTAAFYGWWSDSAFDKVTLTETVGGIDNEYFGDLHLGATPVPEPASILLIGTGLAGLIRRKRS